MMKMLFVNPPNDNPMTDLKAIEPPIWCALLAADFRKQGHDVAIWDAEVDPVIPEMNYDQVQIVVMGSNPSVSSTPKMPIALQLAKQLEDKGIFVTLTGLHLMTEFLRISLIPIMEKLVGVHPAWD